MSILKKHRFHISRMITFAFLFELALFPHAGQAGIETGALIPVATATQGTAATIDVIPIGEARVLQALPDTEELSLKRTRLVVITAYSSTVDQTDDTPFITANGTQVKDGIIAANFLHFGTRVAIPELFGGKVFYVTDRMHERFSDRVDVWMETREEAVEFGVKVATIEVY